MQKNLLTLFKLAFPEIITDPPRPLKIGIGDDLVAALAVAGVSRPEARVKKFLQSWTLRESYLEVLLAGSPRFGLDGKPSGFVTEAEAAAAALKLPVVSAIKADAAARRAAFAETKREERESAQVRREARMAAHLARQKANQARKKAEKAAKAAKARKPAVVIVKKKRHVFITR